MFKKLFGGSSSSSKVDDAVKYFFEFSLHLLDMEGEGPFYLSESEKYDFRNNYISEKGIENYGVWFFSKIESESTSFANHHLEQKTTFKIGMCCEPVVDMSNPLAAEVKNHLSNII
jgi:hypothetical protein|tara:strand:- start:345 stop:692 length:348 start_codon:yes stop_codon:yes gene_type:complete